MLPICYKQSLLPVDPEAPPHQKLKGYHLVFGTSPLETPCKSEGQMNCLAHPSYPLLSVSSHVTQTHSRLGSVREAFSEEPEFEYKSWFLAAQVVFDIQVIYQRKVGKAALYSKEKEKCQVSRLIQGWEEGPGVCRVSPAGL